MFSNQESISIPCHAAQCAVLRKKNDKNHYLASSVFGRQKTKGLPQPLKKKLQGFHGAVLADVYLHFMIALYCTQEPMH